ncbi:hypothetical protein BD779DRAFT_1680381 [Infundibulicybe gibba]|nr:hypothetical protein BD779DRAFT_1680381 [Infundibulicybe gibba]
MDLHLRHDAPALSELRSTGAFASFLDLSFRSQAPENVSNTPKSVQGCSHCVPYLYLPQAVPALVEHQKGPSPSSLGPLFILGTPENAFEASKCVQVQSQRVPIPLLHQATPAFLGDPQSAPPTSLDHPLYQQISENVSGSLKPPSTSPHVSASPTPQEASQTQPRVHLDVGNRISTSWPSPIGQENTSKPPKLSITPSHPSDSHNSSPALRTQQGECFSEESAGKSLKSPMACPSSPELLTCSHLLLAASTDLPGPSNDPLTLPPLPKDVPALPGSLFLTLRAQSEVIHGTLPSHSDALLSPHAPDILPKSSSPPFSTPVLRIGTSIVSCTILAPEEQADRPFHTSTPSASPLLFPTAISSLNLAEILTEAACSFQAASVSSSTTPQDGPINPLASPPPSSLFTLLQELTRSSLGWGLGPATPCNGPLPQVLLLSTPMFSAH